LSLPESPPNPLTTIDWAAPWLAPYAPLGRALVARVAAGMTSAQALNVALAPQHCSLHFVPQSDLPAGEAYERYIFNTQRCPTRSGLHDFFNGVCWRTFPQTKRRLNQLHVAQITQTGIQPVRGPARDGLTVFDENAAFLQAPDALWQALAAKDWSRLFGDLRPLWQQARLVLFGHALLEKLVSPRKAITAHVYRVKPAGASLAELDDWVAADLSAAKLATKPFAHLPVLGVPGWWAANQARAFYADVSVFRPPQAL
jgi:hypothetical protein